MVRKTMLRTVEGARGGKGSVEFHDIVTKEELNGHGSLYTLGYLRPGSSIGYHQHVDNTEQYFVLQGQGIFQDTDGSEVPVGPGDVCYIKVGQSHGLINTSDSEDLIFMALIYNAPGQLN